MAGAAGTMVIGGLVLRVCRCGKCQVISYEGMTSQFSHGAAPEMCSRVGSLQFGEGLS